MIEKAKSTPLFEQYCGRFWPAFWAATAGSMIFVFDMTIAEIIAIDSWAVSGTGALLFVGGIIVIARGLVCPMCKTNWFLYAIGNAKYGNWMHWLRHTHKCPNCGYRLGGTGEDERASQDEGLHH